MNIRKSLCRVVPVLMLFYLAACGPTENQGNTDGFEVSGISIPSSINVSTGDEVCLKVYGKGPESGDNVILVGEDRQEVSIPVSSCTESMFGFIIPDGLYTGSYTMFIERDGVRVEIGKINLTIALSADFSLEEGTTVYGLVSCAGRPVSDVVISDGYEFAVTDSQGRWQMDSEKHHGYVFMSIPSGYTVKTDKTLPLFHRYLEEPADVAERVDFVLVEDPGQERHTMVVMGDIHLAKRNNDIAQFQEFVNDLNGYMSEKSSVNFYGLTLGDLAWDQFWIANGYDLTNYLKDMSALNALTVFNTIGNHDHEQNAQGDFNTVSTYKKIIGPTYYSFNIGKVHYVVLDDIECTNPGTGERTYNTKIVDDQIEWLKKDLEFVDDSTPVVLSSHSPFYNAAGENRLTNSSAVIEALEGRKAHILTGHTHVMYNVDYLNQDGTGHFEHNAGAVCATWWWSGAEVPGIHIATDGAPGGYLLFEVDGTDFEWVFKGTGHSISHQFRTYDRNEIEMTSDVYVPDANKENVQKFMDAAKEYSSPSTANEVLINVWNYDEDWEIEVYENGHSLDVSRITARDPLHLISYSAKRLNKNKTATFLTGTTGHMFKAQASSANSTLNIKVTDRFGNVYTEDMVRPKAFTFENYK